LIDIIKENIFRSKQQKIWIQALEATRHFSVHKPSPELMVKNWNLAGNFIKSTTAQMYPFCSYIDPTALMITDACFCQAPGQVQLENTYQRNMQLYCKRVTDTWHKSNGKQDI